MSHKESDPGHGHGAGYFQALRDRAIRRCLRNAGIPDDQNVLILKRGRGLTLLPLGGGAFERLARAISHELMMIEREAAANEGAGPSDPEPPPGGDLQ